jgi:alkylation response protein AidB-like acyl-CoA dehydrogenase
MPQFCGLDCGWDATMNKHFSGTMSELFLSEQQRMVRDAARKLGKDVLAPTAAERDRTSAWPTEELKVLGAQGFMGMTIPQEYGGSASGFLAYCLAIEELSAADGGVGTIVHVHNLGAAHVIAKNGTAEQKQRLLPTLASGAKIGAFLITEPQAGSETSALRATARRDGDDFVINGTKQFISNGSEAGVAIIVARTNESAGKRGFTTFLVEPPAKGYIVNRVEDKLGQRTAHTAQIQLDDLRVPKENILGTIDGGYGITMSGLSDGRIAVAAQAVGIAQAALQAAVHYARERVVAGKPIMDLQGISFALADMAAQVDVARQYYIHAARLLEAGLPCAKEAAIAKLFASEMAEKVCSEALQIHGGYGYLRDFPVERYYRDVRVCKIYEGTSNIQKLIIARNL